MKALIPVNIKNNIVKIHKSIETSDICYIYDSENGSFSKLEIEKLLKKHETESFFDAVSKEGITVIITPSMKMAAFYMLKKKKIEIFLPEGENLPENIEKFKSNFLKKMDESNLIQPKGCFSNCSKCSSKCES
jgi:predicted Fe-Mo cluster-binding NifX family protein